jgi:hypothetical protein
LWRLLRRRGHGADQVAVLGQALAEAEAALAERTSQEDVVQRAAFRLGQAGAVRTARRVGVEVGARSEQSLACQRRLRELGFRMTCGWGFGCGGLGGGGDGCGGPGRRRWRSQGWCSGHLRGRLLHEDDRQEQLHRHRCCQCPMWPPRSVGPKRSAAVHSVCSALKRATRRPTHTDKAHTNTRIRDNRVDYYTMKYQAHTGRSVQLSPRVRRCSQCLPL